MSTTKNTKTINSRLLTLAARRPAKGFTVYEATEFIDGDPSAPFYNYSSIRARVYELAKSGKLVKVGVRTVDGVTSTVFRAPTATVAATNA